MIPLWTKISYPLFALLTFGVYAVKYLRGNFLWFPDIAMILTVPALWLESSLLASMPTVGILIPEVFGDAAYFGRLLFGKRLAGLTDHMLDASRPRSLRALSLFHVFLPVLLLWMVARLGYAPQTLVWQTALAWVVFPLTYWLADPKLNVNGMFGPAKRTQAR